MISVQSMCWKNTLWVALFFLLAGSVAGVAQEEKKPQEVLTESIKMVRFFESSYNATPFKDRVYRVHFLQSRARYINWELNFELEPLGYRLDYRVVAHCRDEKGMTVFKQKKDAYIDTDWTTPWTSWGYGSKAGGSWEPGKYTVDFTVKGKSLARSHFIVLSDAEAGLRYSSIWDGSVPLIYGSRILKLVQEGPAVKMCSALLESPRDKLSTWHYYKKVLPEKGWIYDKGVVGEEETGSLKNESIWGLMNFTRDGCSLTLIIPSDKNTGIRTTRVDMTRINHKAGFSAAQLAGKIPRLVVSDSAMNRRFANTEWALTVRSATVEGSEIVKSNNFSNRKYSFYSGSPDLYLVKVTVDLERLNKKPINSDFLVKVMVQASDGKAYPCIGAGTELGDYYDMRKGGSQSILQPTIDKSEIEYVFALPLNAAVRAFVWPGLDPIPIQVK